MTKCPATRSALCGAALALLLGGCTTVVPTIERWDPAPVGAVWSAQQRNTGSYGADMVTATTRAADVVWNGAPALALKMGARTLLQRPTDGSWLALLGADGKPLFTYDPPLGFPMPATVGTRWKRLQKMTNLTNGRTTEWEWNCQVVAYEKVAVPAGTFDAFRTECTSSLDAQDTYWTSPKVHPFLKTKLVRGPKHPAGPGTSETELLKLPS